MRDREPGESSECGLLDRLVGGLSANLPVVLTGADGSGRTVVCLELVTRWCQAGGAAVFVTAEPAALVVRQAESLGLELEQYVKSEQCALLELDPSAADKLTAHGSEALYDALHAELPEASLIIIDPLTALTSTLLDQAEMRGIVRSLFGRAGSAHQVVVASADAEILERASEIAQVFRESCGVFVELNACGANTRELSVVKSRSAGHSTEPLVFSISSQGLERTHGAESEPARVPAAAQPAPGAADAPDEDTRRPRVLVVEDDRLTRMMARDWLSADYEVDEVEDGFAAVSSVIANPPDLVVLDLQLPRADGYEVLRAVRGAGAQFPILVVSGTLNRGADRLRALVLGATDLLRKPAQRFELLSKVETLLKNATPTPLNRGVDDAEALLGNCSGVQTLDEEALRDRAERARRFGADFGLASVVVAIEGPSVDLDGFLGSAERTLRGEDAIARISKSRALLLLVGTELDVVEIILIRCAADLDDRDAALRRLRYSVVHVADVPSEGDWAPCFESLLAMPSRPERSTS